MWIAENWDEFRPGCRVHRLLCKKVLLGGIECILAFEIRSRSTGVLPPLTSRLARSEWFLMLLRSFFAFFLA